MAQVLASFVIFSLLSPAPPPALLTTSAAAEPVSLLSLGIATVAAGLVLFGLDALIGPMLLRLKYGMSWRDVFVDIILPAVPSDALAVATVLVAVPVASFSAPSAAVVLMGGAFLTSLGVAGVREHRKRWLRLEAENAALREGLRNSNAEFASRLVGRLGARDGYSAAHAAASAVYAYDIAREMSLDEDHSRKVRLAALLMDVGLLWIPDEVLLTHPDKLNSVGKMRLEEHPKGSGEVLIAVAGFGEAARWVRWHHERPDGTGYPDRLPGGWIPTEAKILAASSLYASLIFDGPYTRGEPAPDARRALVGGMGKTVDDEVVRTFLRVLEDEGPEYASAMDASFCFPTHGRASNALSFT